MGRQIVRSGAPRQFRLAPFASVFDPAYSDQVDPPFEIDARSISMFTRSPSLTLPIVPPASASGPTWPMQAPVETPRSGRR